MTRDNREHALRGEWRMSREAWNEAEVLREAGHPRGALTRYYYASFHAVCAILLSDGVEAGTHAGVRGQFYQRFLKTGRLDRDLAGSLAGLQQQREDADYDREAEVDDQQVGEVRREADRVIGQIRNWLQNEGWLE